MVRILFGMLLFVSVLNAHGQSCGTKNYLNAVDYVACTSALSAAPTNLDGTPSTSDAFSRYQWNMRALLEGESYSSLFSDAPADVTVAVIGEWPGHMGHPDLVNTYLTGINTIEGGTVTSPTWDGQVPTVGNAHDQCAAGIIAAEHNSVGMAGVFHRARILPIRASWLGLPLAISSAVAAGAKVIHIAGYALQDEISGVSQRRNQMFLEHPGGMVRPAYSDTTYRDSLLPTLNAMRLAIEAANEAGVVIVKGVRNDAGLIMTDFIASRKQVIAVGATNAHDEISAYNATSYSYEIFAPGGDRREFAWGAIAGITAPIYEANLDDPMCPMGPSGYSFLTLGSAAAPHVAAAAAIVKSYKPTATVEEVRRLLQKSTRAVRPNLNVLQSLGGLLSLKKLKANLVP